MWLWSLHQVHIQYLLLFICERFEIDARFMVITRDICCDVLLSKFFSFSCQSLTVSNFGFIQFSAKEEIENVSMIPNREIGPKWAKQKPKEKEEKRKQEGHGEKWPTFVSQCT